MAALLREILPAGPVFPAFGTFALFPYFRALNRNVLYKLVVVLYLVCFGLYVWFSRQPDYFDGEIVPGHIHFVHDSLQNKPVPVAEFAVGKEHYKAQAAYLFRQFSEGQQVPVIYEAADPAKAAVYSWWGYWIRWEECLGSLLMLFAGLRIAIAVTANPDPSVPDEAELPRRKKRKYTS